MSEDRLDKTNVVDGDTLKIRLDEVRKAPPALILLMGPTGLIGKQWPIDRADLLIGRDAVCDINIVEKSLSKRHAKIVKDGDEVSIVDQGSTNGTEVAGTKLSAHTAQVLNNNDSIKLGNIILKFVSQGNLETTLAATFDRAIIDGLTQIFNKKTTLEYLEESFRRANLTKTALSMIVFDLDHFKKINDSYGHQAGDYVLRETASVIKNQLIRAGDIFGRYGGEEFVIILYGSPLQRTCDIAERIRSTIEKHEFRFGDKVIAVTVSLGVATLDPTMPNADALFAKADQATYVSKNAGRNRVSTI
jgi:two-component system, cell cycle response regulator